MQEFANFILGPLQTPVLDMTGLAGKYDFALDLTPYFPEDGQKPDVVGLMIAALQGELGLKLESRRAPIEVLVIDHVEQPSEN